MSRSWLKSNAICIAMGDAVASNLMFETMHDHQLFFSLWDKYLGRMSVLINYSLTPTGWILLFRTNSKDEIKTAYWEQRKQSKKAKSESALHDESRMLSEHFRIFLSQYVRQSNRNHQRKGTKVMERFHRYILNETSDYDKLFESLTRQRRKDPQIKEKYQANLSEYDKEDQMKDDSIWKVGTRMYQGFEMWFRMKFRVELIYPQSSVLRKYLKSQISTPIPQRFT